MLEDFDDLTLLLGSVLYVLALNGQAVYVGRSSNLIARLLRHRRAGTISFNRVLVRRVPRDLAPAQEAELIRELRPTMNVASATKVRRLSRNQIEAQAAVLLRQLGWADPRRRL